MIGVLIREYGREKILPGIVFAFYSMGAPEKATIIFVCLL